MATVYLNPETIPSMVGPLPLQRHLNIIPHNNNTPFSIFEGDPRFEPLAAYVTLAGEDVPYRIGVTCRYAEIDDAELDELLGDV